MSLLTACQDAADAIGLARPTTIISNSNKEARQLLYYAQREIFAERDCYDWQQVIKEGTVTGDGAANALTLPTDFYRLVSDTTWDRTDNRQAAVGVNSREWAYLQGWDIVTTLNRRARIIDDKMEFYQIVPNLRDVHFEYISKNLIDVAVGGPSEKAEFTADDDVSLIDDDLLTLGIVWRYTKARQQKRWRADREEYDKKLRLLTAFQNAPRTLTATRHRNRSWGVQVKDNGYG